VSTTVGLNTTAPLPAKSGTWIWMVRVRFRCIQPEDKRYKTACGRGG
jgi:hypothetical protein